MNYRINHCTTYHYAELVSLCQNLLHLHPRVCPQQVCHQTQLTVDPIPGPIMTHQDYFGNPVAVFTIQHPHRRLMIAAQHTIEVQPPPPVPANYPVLWDTVADSLRNSGNVEVTQFTFDSRYIRRTEELADYAQPSFPTGRPFVEAVLDLTQRIHADFHYDQKATNLTTPIREVLRNRRGVCQDFAHLQIACLRSLGLAGRYVSGYLRTKPPPGKERLVGADASHAWLSAYCPELGWIDFDPTNNLIPSDQHITLAWGRDYDDVSPIRGVILGGGSHTMTVSVDVEAMACEPEA